MTTTLSSFFSVLFVFFFSPSNGQKAAVGSIDENGKSLNGHARGVDEGGWEWSVAINHNKIPPELALHIAQYVEQNSGSNKKDLVALALVNKLWFATTLSKVWTKLTIQDSTTWHGFSNVLSSIAASPHIRRAQRTTLTVPYTTALQILQLSNIATQIDFTAWDSLVSHCHSLKRISLENINFKQSSRGIPVAKQGHTLPALEAFSVLFCLDIHPWVIQRATNAAPELTELTLAATKLMECHICSILETTPKLTTLTLGTETSSRRPFASSEGLGVVNGSQIAITLAVKCPDLGSLELSGTYALSALAFAGMVIVNKSSSNEATGSGEPSDESTQAWEENPQNYRKSLLRRLALRAATSHLSDPVHRLILSHPLAASSLTSLTLCDAPAVTDDTLLAISQACGPTLEFLELGGLNIGDAGLRWTTLNCENLMQLHLKELPKFMDLSSILCHPTEGAFAHPNLTVLKLERLPKLSELTQLSTRDDDNPQQQQETGDIDIPTMTVGCPKLTLFEIYECPALASATVDKLRLFWGM